MHTIQISSAACFIVLAYSGLQIQKQCPTCAKLLHSLPQIQQMSIQSLLGAEQG